MSMAVLNVDLAKWFSALRRVVVLVALGVLLLSEYWLGLQVSFAWGLPPIALLVVVEVIASSNLFKGARLGSEWLVLGYAAADIVAFAVVLGASGGAANPFTAVLFAYVALAASLLSPLRTFLLAAFSAITFGSLFLLPSDPSCHAPTMDMADHFYGMWVAFAVGALLSAFFLTRVRKALIAHQQEIEQLRKEQADAARFVALGTLAAGTAHELGTPLSTIAVLAEELSHNEFTRERAESIVNEVARCREVLTRMRPGAKKELAHGCRLGEVVPQAVRTWLRAHPRARASVEVATDSVVPMGSNDVEAALSVLLDNALAAVPAETGEVRVLVSCGATGPCLVVEDNGSGVDGAVVDRLGEPFVSTKDPGEGMGLGLFVIRTLFEQAGGTLSIEPNQPSGTRVVLAFGAAPGLADKPSSAPKAVSVDSLLTPLGEPAH
jgi:two-component system sensor histidine kinase RegB